MSIRAIGTLAVSRDSGKRAAAGVPPPAPAAAPAAAAPAGPGGVTPPAGTLDTLSAVIPSDVAAAYTTVIGVLSGALAGNTTDKYIPLRWWLYAGCLAGTVLASLISYRTAAAGNAQRRFPWAEAFTASVAFAFWGLVVPGSSLYLQLKSPLLPIVIALLSVSGVFALTSVLKPLLDRPAKP